MTYRSYTTYWFYRPLRRWPTRHACYTNAARRRCVEIVEAADPNAIAAMRDEWNDLLDRTETATIYQTWEWNEAWWRSFGRGKRLRLIQVREAGRLAGIAPFYVSFHYRLPLRKLSFVGTGASDYLDVIAERDTEQQVGETLLQHLRQIPDYDMADL